MVMKNKFFIKYLQKSSIPLLKESTIIISFNYYGYMADLFNTTSTSPLTAILWCLYPMAVLLIIELLLGGGFDDDNNDDQDGGMLIPAYSKPNL